MQGLKKEKGRKRKEGKYYESKKAHIKEKRDKVPLSQNSAKVGADP